MRFILTKLPSFFAKYFMFSMMSLLFAGQVLAARWATVTSDKAVIYADLQMSAPIGYLRKGKNIRVGDVRKNKGQLLPTVINKRVVYIKVKDIVTSDSLKDVKEVVRRGREEKIEVHSINRMLLYGSTALTSLKFIPFDDLGKSNTEEQQSLLFLGGGFRFSTFRIKKNYEFRLGLDYSLVKKDETEFTFTTITTDMSFPIINSEFFKLNFYFGPHFMPITRYKASDFFTINGHGYGVQSGIETIISMGKKWSIHVDGGYHYSQLKGFQIPVINEKPKINFDPTLTSFKVTAGLSYKID